MGHPSTLKLSIIRQARHYGTNFHELSLLILQKSHNFINCILQMRKSRAGDTQYLVQSESIKAELLLLLLLSRFSRVQLCATPQTAAHQAPPSLGFSRQEH